MLPTDTSSQGPFLPSLAGSPIVDQKTSHRKKGKERWLGEAGAPGEHVAGLIKMGTYSPGAPATSGTEAPHNCHQNGPRRHVLSGQRPEMAVAAGMVGGTNVSGPGSW